MSVFVLIVYMIVFVTASVSVSVTVSVNPCDMLNNFCFNVKMYVKCQVSNVECQVSNPVSGEIIELVPSMGEIILKELQKIKSRTFSILWLIHVGTL